MCVPDKPMDCFRCPPNLQNALVRARLPTEYLSEASPSCGQCGKSWCQKWGLHTTFPPQSSIQCTSTGKSHILKYTNANVSTSQVIYHLTCRQCDLHYVGLCTTPFRIRMSNHKSAIKIPVYQCWLCQILPSLHRSWTFLSWSSGNNHSGMRGSWRSP